jgi:phage-related protein
MANVARTRCCYFTNNLSKCRERGVLAGVETSRLRSEQEHISWLPYQREWWMMERMRPVIWLGDSLANLKEFPDDVQKSIGDDLQVVQWGGTPVSAKHFKGIGSGVYEIVENSDTNTYRAVYAVKLGKRVYVLHAFQKKSKTGIKTPQHDVELIRRRYNVAVERAQGDDDERRKH